jgi:hypothetical protein
MKQWLPAALAATLLLGSCQTVQQPLRPGMTRTAISASYSDLDQAGADTKELNIQGAWGTFWESDQEIGLKVGYDDLEVNGSSSEAWSLAMYGRYYLATTNTLLPWVELDLGWMDNDADSNILWSAGVGITQFVSQGGAIEAGIEYIDTFGDLETSGLRLLMGYSIFF